MEITANGGPYKFIQMALSQPRGHVSHFRITAQGKEMEGRFTAVPLADQRIKIEYLDPTGVQVQPTEEPSSTPGGPGLSSGQALPAQPDIIVYDDDDFPRSPSHPGPSVGTAQSYRQRVRKRAPSSVPSARSDSKRSRRSEDAHSSDPDYSPSQFREEEEEEEYKEPRGRRTQATGADTANELVTMGKFTCRFYLCFL